MISSFGGVGTLRGSSSWFSYSAFPSVVISLATVVNIVGTPSVHAFMPNAGIPHRFA